MFPPSFRMGCPSPALEELQILQTLDSQTCTKTSPHMVLCLVMNTLLNKEDMDSDLKNL